MKVLVCGDRNWKDWSKIRTRLVELKPSSVITGGARGADTIAAISSSELGVPVQVFPANWSTYGRAAGPIRNREMLDQYPDLVLAFHSDLSKSKGTADCVREARKRGIKVEVVT